MSVKLNITNFITLDMDIDLSEKLIENNSGKLLLKLNIINQLKIFNDINNLKKIDYIKILSAKILLKESEEQKNAIYIGEVPLDFCIEINRNIKNLTNDIFIIRIPLDHHIEINENNKILKNKNILIKIPLDENKMKEIKKFKTFTFLIDFKIKIKESLKTENSPPISYTLNENYGEKNINIKFPVYIEAF